jgi:hypothetical protein
MNNVAQDSPRAAQSAAPATLGGVVAYLQVDGASAAAESTSVHSARLR